MGEIVARSKAHAGSTRGRGGRTCDAGTPQGRKRHTELREGPKYAQVVSREQAEDPSKTAAAQASHVRLIPKLTKHARNYP